MINRLKEVYEQANRELSLVYQEAGKSPSGDYSKWDGLRKSEESLVGEARQILRQILHDFDRTSASDGSWNDETYFRFMEYDPRRLVETYCSDEEGLSVTMDYSLPKLKLEAKRFPQGISVPRPSWNRMLSEEERKNRPTGTKVDVWETLEQLVK